MRKHVIISTLLIIYSNWGRLLAQSPFTYKIDSLQHLLKTQSKEDTLKIIRWNDLARICFENLQFQQGLVATQQARLLSEKLRYRKGKGLYLRTMEIFHVSNQLSFFYNIHAKWHSTDLGEKEVINDTYSYLLPSKVDYDLANSQLLVALKYFEQQKDKELVAHILFSIGTTDLRLNKASEAKAYLERAKKLFKEIGRDEFAFCVLYESLISLEENNKIKQAIEIEKEAKSIISNIKTEREKELLNYYLALIYYSQNKNVLFIEQLMKTDYELEKIGEIDLRPFVLSNLGDFFDNEGMYQKSLDYFNKLIELKIETNQSDDIASQYVAAVFELVPLKKWDEAKQYLEKAKLSKDKIKNKRLLAFMDVRLHDAAGQILMGQEKYQEALTEFFQANQIANESNNERYFLMYTNTYIAQCYQKLGDVQKSIVFAKKKYDEAMSSGDIRLKINNNLLLSEVYEKSGQFKLAFEYLKKYRSIIKEKEENDIDNLATNLSIENIVNKNEKEKAALEKAKLIKEQENQNQRWWIFSIAAALISSIIILYVLYRNNQIKQKANTVLVNTLSQLKSTQAQLIQSEKMASLGELTAGIAHEIQNPLNFVNNFSEVNKELLVELKDEIKKGNLDEVNAIADDVISNEEKINHHGKRAESIVKGMLEHSRKSTGIKEPTDINKLCDEFVRLSYHGLRAKDPKFSCDYKLDLDPYLPLVHVVSQDIGRVILNVITNAFYVVDEKKKSGTEGYEPTVSVSTKKVNGKIEIIVADNGNGIPQKILDKIFQPFFTTKPTGKGTGLGLSLSYDIVKAHGGTIVVNTFNGPPGGELKVETKEGEGSQFIIYLPIS